MPQTDLINFQKACRNYSETQRSCMKICCLTSLGQMVKWALVLHCLQKLVLPRSTQRTQKKTNTNERRKFSISSNCSAKMLSTQQMQKKFSPSITQFWKRKKDRSKEKWQLGKAGAKCLRWNWLMRSKTTWKQLCSETKSFPNAFTKTTTVKSCQRISKSAQLSTTLPVANETV